MNILFLMIAYPDVSVNTSMYTDLTSEFAINEHNVFVVAPTEFRTTFGKEGYVNVLRVKTGKLFNVNPIVKGISNVLLPFQYGRSIKTHLKDIKFDLIVIPTPPITFLSLAKKLKLQHKCKLYLILRDIFPQNALDLGLIKNKIVFNYFRKIEKELYRVSDSIGCMSQGNIDFVVRHNSEVCTNKLHLLPNWIRPEFIDDNKEIRSKYGLDDKFIAIYGGNLGKPQKAEFIIDLAEKVKDLSDILFLMIGNGTEKSKILEMIKNRGVSNVRFMDSLPRIEYKKLVRQCDIGLVNLSDRFTIPNIPSRTLSYFEAQIPILAAIDENTDFSKIIDESKSGLWSITGDIDSYYSNFMKLYRNKEQRVSMGINGFRYMVSDLNVEKAYTIIKDYV